ncbi:MAG TPA: hypothetical protein VG013_41155 [Gemmataceae bacterium]|jgi:hypothetical protein|nr:hypothetical protein [Gemmataceae bacterium]
MDHKWARFTSLLIYVVALPLFLSVFFIISIELYVAIASKDDLKQAQASTECLYAAVASIWGLVLMAFSEIVLAAVSTARDTRKILKHLTDGDDRKDKAEGKRGHRTRKGAIVIHARITNVDLKPPCSQSGRQFMSSTKRRYSKEEFARRGDAIYKKKSPPPTQGRRRGQVCRDRH